MSEIEIRNAVINKTMLGFEDHGIFTCWIDLDYGYGGQGFGGRAFGGEYTDKFIRGLLETLKIEKWEDLIGTHIRAKQTNGAVYEVGHILEDRWFNPDKLIDPKEDEGESKK